MLTKEQKDNELVKSLLDGGFDEETIAAWIEKGDLTLEKSEEGDPDPDEDNKKDPDEGGEGDGGSEPDPDEKGDDDDPDDGDDEKKSCGKKKKSCGKGKGCDSDKDIEKSLDGFKLDIVKSIHEEVESQMGEVSEAISKSIGEIIENKLEDIINRFEKSLEGITKVIGNQTPHFKGAGLSRAVIEKSNGLERDENDKVVLSVSRDREAVRTLISKSIEEEKDATLHKSLVDGTREYLIDPLYGEINRDAAQYMYDKKGVRLVK